MGVVSGYGERVRGFGSPILNIGVATACLACIHAMLFVNAQYQPQGRHDTTRTILAASPRIVTLITLPDTSSFDRRLTRAVQGSFPQDSQFQHFLFANPQKSLPVNEADGFSLQR